MKRYIKDGVVFTSGTIVLGDRRIYNPTEEMLLEAGYTLMEEPEYTPTLEDVKRNKIAEIDNYDSSEAVNSFKLNDMDCWLSVNERLNYDRSIRAYEELDIQNAKFFINGEYFEVPVSEAKTMLSAIQLYADASYIVTMKHKQAVEGLETIEEVESYDYTVDYPDKLEFSL